VYLKFLFSLYNTIQYSLQFTIGNIDRGTIASVVIQAIGSGTNEETLLKATHPMIRFGQFGACTKLD